MKKRMYCLWFCMILLVTLFSPAANVQAKVKPKLYVKNKTMYVGKTAVITLKKAGKVKWKTSKKSVVAITKKRKNKVSIKASSPPPPTAKSGRWRGPSKGSAGSCTVWKARRKRASFTDRAHGKKATSRKARL